MPVPTDKETIKRAHEMFHDEGRIEVDIGLPRPVSGFVSRAEENEARGAYVQAWVWVPDPQTWFERTEIRE